MGDRGNIYIKEHEAPGFYLYSHWGGSDLPKTLQSALQRKERWDDSEYLARIIFQEMLDGDTGSTGFGIATYIADNEHPILVVDAKTKTVGLTDRDNVPTVAAPVSFSQFCELTEQELETFFDRAK